MGDPLPKPGDVLMSSGTGGIYPPDIPVARVLRVGRDSAIARPFAQPGTLDVAMVQRAFFPLPPPLPPSQNAPAVGAMPATSAPTPAARPCRWGSIRPRRVARDRKGGGVGKG